MPTAREAIKKVYGDSNNFMTPNVLETGWIIKNKLAYELSSGRFIDKRLLGLSVVEKTYAGWRKATDISECISKPMWVPFKDHERDIRNLMLKIKAEYNAGGELK